MNDDPVSECLSPSSKSCSSFDLLGLEERRKTRRVAVRILTEIGVLSERIGVLDLFLDLNDILFEIQFRFGFILREL